MFELVRQNKRRSVVLVLLMLMLLLALGFAIGAALVPSLSNIEVTDGGELGVSQLSFDPTPGFIGMGIAFIIWMVQALVAYYQGDAILLAISRARKIEKDDHPQLFNVVEEMTIASRLPKVPDIYIIDDMALNAFAAGRKPETSKVAITAGLLAKLNRDQLQGVIAHEIAHIKNRDVLFMTMVGIMLGTIVMLSEVFLRNMFYANAANRRYSSGNKKGGGGGHMIFMVIAVVLAILAPLLAQLIYFASSRQREYLADAGAALFTRYPEGLASALELLGRDTRILASANKATAGMYIINPLHKEGTMALNITSTHPPLDKRIKILRSLGGGISYGAYMTAAMKVAGGNSVRMPPSAMKEAPVQMRGANSDSKSAAEAAMDDPKKRMRQAGDLMRQMSNFIFLSCVCGMRVKLPPDFKQDHVDCPKCHRDLQVPVAALAALHMAGAQIGQDTEDAPGAAGMAEPRGAVAPLEVKHTRGVWQSIKCSCGAIKNIGPSFSGKQTECAKCGRSILLK